ncbi:F-box/kelch-repeat protein At3g06240-like [Rutidosis leptorrhynchoides]|uniref:F-box/kelch-repeat protein At3g06240-like n=1 Tax=Rutidosis leptorrhynchoides TaxID=125765 RepID=UPI003A9A3E0A
MSNMIFKLPQDIIFDILSRLPIKSLLQFRCVCTSSPPLISHPSFTNLRLSSTTAAAAAADHRLLIYYESTDYINQFYSLRSPISFQETLKLQIPYKTLHGYLRIVGSNKGLICFFDTNYYSNIGTVILWNPSIQKFKKIDDPIHVVDKFSHFIIGFGFVSKKFEFKVVKIAYYLDNFKVHNDVLVYSLSTNSWKKKDGMIAPCYLMRGWSNNVFVNGFVNWLAFKEVISGVESVIMAFDLDKESFRVLELPRNIVPGYDQVCLVSYKESMSLCAHYFELNGERWDMWVMRNYRLVDSWNKVCVVSHPALSIPPLLMKNDHEVLVALNDGSLMLFDVIKNEMHDLETRGLHRSFCAISYTASLALLDG